MTTKETVRQAFLAHRREHGLPAATRIIRNVTGRDDLDFASGEQLQRLLEEFEGGGHDDAANEPPADFTNADGTLNATAIFAKWNRAKRR